MACVDGRTVQRAGDTVRLLGALPLMAEEDETVKVRPIAAGVCVSVVGHYGDTWLQIDLSDQQANSLVSQLAQVLQ